jgi:hypothetical protein
LFKTFVPLAFQYFIEKGLSCFVCGEAQFGLCKAQDGTSPKTGGNGACICNSKREGRIVRHYCHDERWFPLLQPGALERTSGETKDRINGG